MKPLIVHSDAEAELWAEVEYYEQRAPGLGLDFLSEAERAFTRILGSPARWPHAAHGTQVVLLRRFPHSVYYRDLPAAVWIIAIAAQKRRPHYWRSRGRGEP
ncbi:MAG: type II toxin-antitoxin system RelE/ParE family toxin [Candidatus Eisenbacteria bacterium]|nr:type II toxin-antitoxin system RelE/ParE family toxin [Candidatus Eisenbacteria bacterium]